MFNRTSEHLSTDENTFTGVNHTISDEGVSSKFSLSKFGSRLVYASLHGENRRLKEENIKLKSEKLKVHLEVLNLNNINEQLINSTHKRQSAMKDYYKENIYLKGQMVQLKEEIKNLKTTIKDLKFHNKNYEKFMINSKKMSANVSFRDIIRRETSNEIIGLKTDFDAIKDLSGREINEESRIKSIKKGGDSPEGISPSKASPIRRFTIDKLDFEISKKTLNRMDSNDSGRIALSKRYNQQQNDKRYGKQRTFVNPILNHYKKLTLINRKYYFKFILNVDIMIKI